MSITNDFLPFCPTDTGTNLESQANYLIDSSRTDGNQPGIASSKLNNKALRQGTFVASQLAQWVANKLNQNVLDDGVPADLLAQFYSAFSPNDSFAVENLAFTTSVGSSALTIALKTQAGTDPSAIDVAYVGTRNATITTGNFNKRSITAALSLTVPSGATLGMSSGVSGHLYLYALDNAGAIELGIINGLLDEGSVQTSTAITSGSSSLNVLYSGSARSNVAVRLIGRILISEVTAGTWASNATELSVMPFYSAQRIFSTLVRSGGTSLTTGTPVNVTSISCPIGTFDISGAVGFAPNTSTAVSRTDIAVSTTTATLPGGDHIASPDTAGQIQMVSGFGTTVEGSDFVLSIPSYRVRFSTATTLFLVSQANFTISTVSTYGFLQAIRATGSL